MKKFYLLFILITSIGINCFGNLGQENDGPGNASTTLEFTTCAFNSFEDGYEIVISVTYCGTTIFSESYDTNICPPFKVKWNCEANDNGCQYKIDVSMYNTQGVKKAGCSYSYYGCLNLITYLGNTNWGIWHSPVIID